MAFNSAQFKQKKKRAVNPDAPPRPNLLTHEKKMKESQIAFNELRRIVLQQEDELRMLKHRMNDMQSSIGMLVNYLKKNK